MGTQAQIPKTPPKRNIKNRTNANNISNTSLPSEIQHPNINNNVSVKQSKETNEYRISFMLDTNSYWERSYRPNDLLSLVLEDFKREHPDDYPIMNEIQPYINQTLIESSVPLSSIVKKGIQKSELTFTYNMIGIEDFVFDSVNYIKHEIHFIGKPFPNPFTLLIFCRREKGFKPAEFALDSINKSNINNYSNLSAYCNGRNCIFLSGGEKGVLLSDFWEIDLVTQVIQKHPLGIIPKKQHSMIYIPKNSVFIVGGSDKSTVCYNIKRKQMENWAELNTEHIEPALAVVDSKYLYSFSNCKSKPILFERTNLRSMPKWDKIVPVKGNFVQFNQKFFGVCEENQDALIFIGGSMLEYDSNSRIDRYCFVYNHRSNRLCESNIKFEEINLGEKTFLPFNSKFSFIIPNVGLRNTKLLIYNKKKEQVDVLRFEIPKEYKNENRNINSQFSMDKDGSKSTIIPKKYLFKLPQLEEKEEINNTMGQSQIGNQLNITNMLNTKEEVIEASDCSLFKENSSHISNRNAKEEDLDDNEQKEIVIINQKEKKEEMADIMKKNDPKEIEVGVYTEIELIKGKEDNATADKQNEISFSNIEDNNDISREGNKSIGLNSQKEVLLNNNNNNDNKTKEQLNKESSLEKGIVTIIKKKRTIPEDKSNESNSIEKKERPIELNNDNAKPTVELPDTNIQTNQNEKKEDNVKSKKTKEKANKKKNKSREHKVQDITEHKTQKDAEGGIIVNDNINNIKEQPKINLGTNDTMKEANAKERIRKEKELTKEDITIITKKEGRDKAEIEEKNNNNNKNKNANQINKQEETKGAFILQKAKTTQNEPQRQNKFETYSREDASPKEANQSSISQSRVELKQSGTMVRSSLIKGFGDRKKEIALSGLPQVVKHRSPIQKSRVEISGTFNKNSLQAIKTSKLE